LIFFGPAPVELFEGFNHRKTCRLEPSLRRAVFAPQRLALNQAAQIVQWCPVLFGRFLSQDLVVLPKIGEFQVQEIGLELIIFHG